MNTPPNETLVVWGSGDEWRLSLNEAQRMTAHYRWLAAEHVWRLDFPDLCWCMAQRYGSRLAAFVNEARLVRDQIRQLSR
jgi:hypothetical protein